MVKKRDEFSLVSWKKISPQSTSKKAIFTYKEITKNIQSNTHNNAKNPTNYGQ